jgi:hypothetical protein
MYRGNPNARLRFDMIFSKILTVYEIMWKKLVDPYRPQMTT